MFGLLADDAVVVGSFLKECGKVVNGTRLGMNKPEEVVLQNSSMMTYVTKMKDVSNSCLGDHFDFSCDLQVASILNLHHIVLLITDKL